MQAPLGKGTSTKDIIIQILSEEWPLTVKQIYERAQKSRGLQVSYQAIHKVVQELEEEKIIQKEGKNYKLDKKWIEQLKQYGEGLSKDYCSKEKAASSTEFMHLSFDSFLEGAKFIINNFYFDLPNPEKKIAICFSYHIYAPFGFSGVEHENYKKMIANEEHWAVSKGDTFLDKQFSNYLLGIGKKCITGVDFSPKEETYVQGDYICQMFMPPKCKEELDKLYEKVKSMDEIKVETYFDKVLCANYKIEVIIFKDPKLAEAFRKEFEKIKKEKVM